MSSSTCPKAELRLPESFEPAPALAVASALSAEPEAAAAAAAPAAEAAAPLLDEALAPCIFKPAKARARRLSARAWARSSTSFSPPPAASASLLELSEPDPEEAASPPSAPPATASSTATADPWPSATSSCWGTAVAPSTDSWTFSGTQYAFFMHWWQQAKPHDFVTGSNQEPQMDEWFPTMTSSSNFDLTYARSRPLSTRPSREYST
mmetsp:Transcript_83103/g.225687  ORF Transcript_83103/g.225687 Transcript_83103/m.225687 type:complete len:208 (+) Transcript_83103:339-962(+)